MDDQEQELATFRLQIWELIARQRTRPARDVLGRALAKFPGDSDLVLAAAWVEHIDDQTEEARRLCDQVLQQDPGSPEARALLASIFEEDDAFIEAEGIYRSLIRDFPDSADYTADFAMMLVRTVHHDQAHELAKRAIELAPDHPGARKAIVLTSLMRGEKDNVDTMLNEMMQSDPESIDTVVSVIAVLDDRGDKAEALRIAQEVLKAQPDNDALVKWIIELQHQAHWSMTPIRLLDGDSSLFAGMGVFGIALIVATGHPAARITGAVLTACAAYGLLWPLVLRRLQR